MLICLLAFTACLANGDEATPETPPPQVEELERILYALEKVHPNIVAEVSHEASEETCHMALTTPDEAAPPEIAECFNMVDQHTAQWGAVNMADNNVMVLTLRAQFSREIDAQPATYWDDVLDTGREEYQRSRTEAAVLRREFEADNAAAEEPIEEPMDCGDSGGLTPSPLR